MLKIRDKVKIKTEYLQIFVNRKEVFTEATILDIVPCNVQSSCINKHCPGSIIIDKLPQKCWFHNNKVILEVI